MGKPKFTPEERAEQARRAKKVIQVMLPSGKLVIMTEEELAAREARGDFK